jgi:hypothetical protein
LGVKKSGDISLRSATHCKSVLPTALNIKAKATGKIFLRISAQSFKICNGKENSEFGIFRALGPFKIQSFLRTPYTV